MRLRRSWGERAVRAHDAHHRGRRQLQPGQGERGGQRRTRHRRHGEVEDRTQHGGSGMGPAAPQPQEHHREHRQCQAEQDHRLGLSRIDGTRQEDGEQGDVAGPVPAAHDQDGGGEQPPCPGHRRRVGPAQPSHERTAQLVDRGRRGGAEHAQAQDPAQEVDAAAGDEQGGDLAHGVGEVDREQIPDERRDAERGRLPVEHQGHPEPAVGVPQREVAVMDLRPRQGGPGDHHLDLVARARVVDDRAGAGGQAVARQLVEGTERRTVHERRDQDRHRRGHDPGHAEDVGEKRGEPASAQAHRMR